MRMVNTHEAKTHLSKLLEEVAGGEEIVIAKAGQPLARLVKYQVAREPRVLGFFKGQVTETSDCWEPDEDMSASIAASLFPDGPVSKAMNPATGS